MTAPFHVQYHWLLVIAAIGGIHHPAMDDWFSSKIAARLLRLYISLVVLVQLMLPCSALNHFFFIADNLYDGILDLMIFSAGYLTSCRFVWYYAKRDAYLKMLAWWDDDFSPDSHAAQREELINREMKYVRKFMAGAAVSAFFSLNLWVVSQYFNENKIMKFPALFPYRRQSPDYEIMLTFFLFGSCCYSFGNYAAQFCNLLALVWQLCELRRLKTALGRIIRLDKEERINAELKIWINQHQKLISFYNASWVIMFSHSMEMLATFMASWLFAFNYVQETVPFYDKVSEVFFFSPYGVMFGMTCYYADSVRKEAKLLFDEAYESNWYNLPKKFRDSLVIIAQQTQRPVITKGFKMYVTGNRTFFQIMHSSYSVLNFLIATFRKKRENYQ